VLLDAVVVRCLVVPAVMRLLGAKAWWLPAHLERWLPRFDVDGRPRARVALPRGSELAVGPRRT
jgi:RND superfamily putative drug exporter